jgi:hypothetical protein
MAIKVQSSFAAGELDPALHERTRFDKYQAGLKTARNVIIGKSGRIMSRPGRKYFAQCKTADREVVLYSPKATNVLFEFGHLYVRIHDMTGVVATQELSTVFCNWTESVLPYLKFEYGNRPPYNLSTRVLYIFAGSAGNYTPQVIDFSTLGAASFLTSSTYFSNQNGPNSLVSETLTGTGYAVEYVFTFVRYGVESNVTTIAGAHSLPQAAGEHNSFTMKLGANTDNGFTEMRVYRRPTSAGAYGYIGSTTYLFTSGGDLRATFDDKGWTADYSHQPPSGVDYSPYNASSPVGCVYQQRLVATDRLVEKNIYASRPGVQNEFYRNYPLDSDSALAFRYGSNGYGKPLWMIDADGLVIFTTTGVFLHTGMLSPTNLALDKKGPWVSSTTVPPLNIPGGVIFIDATTNTVRSLSFSTEAASYTGDELSIFSDHFFTKKEVKSWAFHEGQTPLLYVVFTDGTMATFTYEPKQEMRAWTRHDGVYPVEYVCSTGIQERTFFVVNVNGIRYIEESIPRYVLASDLTASDEASMMEKMAAMDGVKSFYSLVNSSLTGADTLELSPITDWQSELELKSGTSNCFGAAVVGTVYRWFHPDDHSAIDLEVTQLVNNHHVIVQPSQEFPSELASTLTLYNTYTSLTGLSHLEGESVSVLIDGSVLCSPYNDDQNYEQLTVVGGILTLPTGVKAAIAHVGLGYVMDFETLDIDTVEQRPVLIESKTCNKVYVKVHNSRGLYIGNEFPAGDYVSGMQDLTTLEVDESDEEIVANRADQPITRRFEVSTSGDWDSNGRICGRQVDPIHFEILSILPDLDDQRR